ncbi:MAG: methenyltetrahydromethanopterin cyclohydrolase [Isosphaeraceae bacterium]
MNLNARALALVEGLATRSEECRVTLVNRPEVEGRVIDCGVQTRGGLRAGLDLARVCMANLAEVTIVPGEVAERPCPYVQVTTDHPVLACLASQYAGWQLSEGKFFALGSGPMRAVHGREPIFDAIGYRETASSVVGVLEGRTLPPLEIIKIIAEGCGVATKDVTLLIAPTASLAGGVQVVARSVETALHKLAELGFDLLRVVSAHGIAPLPPVAKDDLAAIGRTNDAILYGARVILSVTGDDDSLLDVGHCVPSSSSNDYGEPFASIFARYHHDFYAVDKNLFSPAEVMFQNLDTGRVHLFGQPAPDIVARSFFGL